MPVFRQFSYKMASLIRVENFVYYGKHIFIKIYKKTGLFLKILQNLNNSLSIIIFYEEKNGFVFKLFMYVALNYYGFGFSVKTGIAVKN